MTGHPAPTPSLPFQDLVLAPATDADAPEILVLQRCCWAAEALANQRLDIPPLYESLDELRAGLAATDAWVLRRDGRLVGGVRGRLREPAGQVWDIGRLMVAPDQSGRGFGRALLAFTENRAPETVTRYELFTGERSVRNHGIYTRAGYAFAGPEAGVPPVPGTLLMTKPRVPHTDEGPRSPGALRPS